MAFRFDSEVPTPMATKKKAAARKPAKTTGSSRESGAAYKEALGHFVATIKLMHSGDFQGAGTAFDKIAKANPEEPLLAERCRTYSKICSDRSNRSDYVPENAEQRYSLAVFLANAGQCDEAIPLLDQALRENPTAAKYYYARASAYALNGNTEAAVGDLRQAIVIEPAVRFQAVNDSDFEKIREEPVFIDIIEPTPAGT